MSAEHLKECSPSEWWKEIKRLCRVTNSSGGRNNVRKAVRHLEGDRDISPTDFSNHVNWAFLTATEGFFRSPTFPPFKTLWFVCDRLREISSCLFWPKDERHNYHTFSTDSHKEHALFCTCELMVTWAVRHKTTTQKLPKGVGSD